MSTLDTEFKPSRKPHPGVYNVNLLRGGQLQSALSKPSSQPFLTLSIAGHRQLENSSTLSSIDEVVVVANSGVRTNYHTAF